MENQAQNKIEYHQILLSCALGNEFLIKSKEKRWQMNRLAKARGLGTTSLP